eukprot:TRINITY_DN35786_c0_g1_i1.p1 TRINITY_DN35786_c0_g1~~TRINITY_DN35786_c0_g1_i1.p1  ORF type:complete len:572 (+),score=130.41 TRINITY_DN35786_c0_g1_i1:65-1780(+)
MRSVRRRLPGQCRAASGAARLSPLASQLADQDAVEGYLSDARPADRSIAHDGYYPREWFSQKANSTLGMSKGPTDWLERTERRKVGKRLSKDERRQLFWDTEKSIRATSVIKRDGLAFVEPTEANPDEQHSEIPSTGLFFTPFLDWPMEKGCMPFLSPEAVYVEYMRHRRCVETLRRHVSGTQAESAPLDALVLQTAFDATQALVHQLAAQHWNMLFFWKSIVPYGSVHVPHTLKRAFWQAFPGKEGPMVELKRRFKQMVMLHGDLAGDCGRFVWLVHDKAGLSLRATGGEIASYSPISLGFVPLLGLHLSDAVIRASKRGFGDAEDPLEKYFERFWLCVDWHWVNKCYTYATKGALELSVDVAGKKSARDVHVFPTMPTFRDAVMQKSQAEGRADPLGTVKGHIKLWKDLWLKDSDRGPMGPGMHDAPDEDNHADVTWRINQQYHVVGSHSTAVRSTALPFEGQWSATYRWVSQLKAKAQLRKDASNPPSSGMMWPEEPAPLFTLETDTVDPPQEWQEGDPKPWEEAEKQWLHHRVHEKEWDFAKKVVPSQDHKVRKYYGYTHRLIMKYS